MGYPLPLNLRERLGLGPRRRRRVTLPAEPEPEYAKGQVLCSFVVPGNPVAKGRPRLTAGRVYTPERTITAERRIAQYLYLAHPRIRPYSGSVSVQLNFYVTGGRRSDTDNLIKLVLDSCCNGLVVSNDRWVDEIFAWRHWVDIGPRTEITICTRDDSTLDVDNVSSI